MAEIVHAFYYMLAGISCLQAFSKQFTMLARIHFSLIFLFLSLGSISCSNSTVTPEQEVKAVVAQIEVAVRERSKAGVMEHISNTYFDAHGNNKTQLGRVVTGTLLRHQKISLLSVVRSLKISGDTAELALSVAMSGRETDLSVEDNRLSADLYQFSVLFDNEEGDWRVKSASWSRGW